jgi:transcriptional regulator with XRE-family HTH domain
MEPAILLVLDVELIRAGKTRADLARQMGVSRATITRRLGGESRSVQLGGTDAFVDAVSELVDVPAVELWRRALRAWEGLQGSDGGLTRLRDSVSQEHAMYDARDPNRGPLSRTLPGTEAFPEA